MKRQRKQKIEVTMYQSNSDAVSKKNATKTLQTAILLSLLEKGQLSKWQFDLCLEKL